MQNAIKRGRPKKEKNYNSPFAVRLRELIGEKTQNEIAEELNITRQSIGQWTNGNTTPDIATLCKLADYFDVSADYLLCRTDIKSPNTDLQAVCNYTGLSEEAIQKLQHSADKVNKIPFSALASDIIESSFFSDDAELGIVEREVIRFLRYLISNFCDNTKKDSMSEKFISAFLQAFFKEMGISVEFKLPHLAYSNPKTQNYLNSHFCALAHNKIQNLSKFIEYKEISNYQEFLSYPHSNTLKAAEEIFCSYLWAIKDLDTIFQYDTEEILKTLSNEDLKKYFEKAETLACDYFK